jgi:hypothetical protein
MRNVGYLFLVGVFVGACGQAKIDPPAPNTPDITKKISQPPNVIKTDPTRTTPALPDGALLEATIDLIETNSAEISVSLRAVDIPAQDDLALSKIVLKLQEPNKPTITRDLGELPGCSMVEPIDEKALSSIQCFGSGGEDIFELFQEGELLAVRHTMTGSEEENPVKAEDVLRISLQKGAKVKVAYRGDNLEITPEHVGPYKLAMLSKDALLLPNASPADEELISFEPDGVELFLQNGAVCSIAMYSRGPKTKEGLSVGNTIAEFQKQYGPVKWDTNFSTLFFEKEPRLRVVVSYEEVGRDHKLPRPEAKVTNILVGNCEASEPK